MLTCQFKYQLPDFVLDVDFCMQQQVQGIVGASGSGKSTILKNIAGLLTPSNGLIQLNDQLLFSAEKELLVPMHRRNIALIFQQALLFAHLNVLQNLKYAHKWAKHKTSHFELDDIVNLLELKPLLQRKAHQLSGGEAQRVSIGRALLSSPQLILLDEPLTGLDLRLRQQILDFLKIVKEETEIPMLYVTHHPEEIEFLQGEILDVDQGKLH
ncbi:MULTISPECIES: ATP-binding cassette domain-containing protein [Acinetobacter]|uniref:ATP-binding cassette domain-containing protein n=1 Tax=Acinetobacter TaxID=469 RepID=UPI000E344B8D|nr:MULTISPECIES: ATP-binding cassette domain-containing protein [Acinetobacter]RFS26117.1 ATP-binding cassette domain-containing protein [Acinetobacter sp. SWAC5]RKG39948.1 ATP-binding cassette domain-containing protein [Acinetobacter cumulans]RZG56423.1 ATP-binding cassette domain-containing protein [Acinetobacter sp. WCHAc060006]